MLLQHVEAKKLDIMRTACICDLVIEHIIIDLTAFFLKGRAQNNCMHLDIYAEMLTHCHPCVYLEK